MKELTSEIKCLGGDLLENNNQSKTRKKYSPKTEFVSFNDANYLNMNNASKYGIKNKRKYVSGDISRSSASHRFTPLGNEDKDNIS